MDPRLFTYDDARASAPCEPLARLAGWLTDSPMSGHGDLGRSGAVCPFVRKAAHLRTLRVGVHDAHPHEEDRVFADIRASFADLEQIPEPGGGERLGTLVYGFPNCEGEEGIAMLARVYRRHKYYTLTRSRMIAFFHKGSDTPGLWNPDFRPMRAPIPVLSIRFLTEHDAIFASRHRLLTVPYLIRFGPRGARKLLAARRQRPGLI